MPAAKKAKEEENEPLQVGVSECLWECECQRLAKSVLAICSARSARLALL